jgi:uncharacterized membrane protein
VPSNPGIFNPTLIPNDGGSNLEDQILVSLVEVFIKHGVAAMPLISTLLLIIVLYYYRKDQREWRNQTREDLQASIQAIERNTATLNTVAEVSRMRLERRE